MANNITVKDSAGADKTLKTTDNATVHTPHHNVDSLPALAAGTNNIGDTDVLTLVGDSVDLDSDPGTDNHAGVAILLPGVGGHVVGGTVTNPLNMALASVPSHAVTNAGTFAVQATLGAETTKVIGTVNIAASQTVGLAAGTAGIGKLTANDGVDIGNVDVASIAAGDNNIGNVDIVTVPADPFGANADAASATGSISAKLRYIAAGVAADGHVQVDVLTAPSTAVTNAGITTIAGAVSGTEMQVDIVGALPAGTNGIGKLTANSGVDIGDVDVTSMPTGASATQVQGTVAHDSAAANNPVLIGATAANAAPTAVANADVVRLIADLVGRQIILPHAPPEKTESYTSAADITDTNDDEVFAAVASTVHYITHFSAMCSHATTGTWVVLKNNDTVIYSGYCAAAGGGFVANFDVPLKSTSGVHVNVANLTNSSATRVNVIGYQVP